MKNKPTHADPAGSRYLALQRLARAQGRATAELLQLYVLESFLRRLARSQHSSTLVLMGGVLLAAFDLRRATRDVDVLALRADNDPAAVQRLITDILSVDAEDGVTFLQETVAVAVIRDDAIYPGVRASLAAHLASARLKLSVDFNVGDPVVPKPTLTAIPGLLEDDEIEVLAYPKAMIVAEKLVTALQRGRANTRWRDFADLLLLLEGDLVESEMVEALKAVSQHRNVRLQPLGEALEGMAEEAQRRWSAWRKRQSVQGNLPDDFSAVLTSLDAYTKRWLR